MAERHAEWPGGGRPKYVASARYWDIVSLGKSFNHAKPDESQLNRVKDRHVEGGRIESCPNWDEATQSPFVYRPDSSMPATSPGLFRLTGETRRDLGKHLEGEGGEHTRLWPTRLTLAERRLKASVRVFASRYLCSR
jgi:hypothetical protein